MRFVKGISFFLIYPLLMLIIGFFVGVKAIEFFYPGNVMSERKREESIDWNGYLEAQISGEDDAEAMDNPKILTAEEDDADTMSQGMEDASEEAREVLSARETLSADTEYVLEETDIIRKTVVETTWKLPHKYIGMNREQFLAAIESYGAHPPLSELERGFVGLEVLSFSRERVVVQMNYEYLQPGEGFYLAVLDNEVVVLLENQETVYINTGIMLEQLPGDVQQQIIQMMWMEDEESLYGFLETYSS